MANLLGMLIGAAIDRRDGDSGIKGAIIGSLVHRAGRAAVPLAIAATVGWGIRYIVRKTMEADRYDLEDPRPTSEITAGMAVN